MRKMSGVKINSLYICVDDMERAIGFYEELLDMTVTEKSDIYSVFDVGGFRFGLFAYKKMNEKHSFGSNCLPSIAFPDEEKLRQKLKGRLIRFALARIGENLVAEIDDSEGNRIELTAPA